MSKKSKSANALSDLDTLLTRSTVEAPAEGGEEEVTQLSPLARCYIAEAVHSAVRVPSPKLNQDYRLELLTRKAAIEEALKANGNEAAAIVEVVKNIAIKGDLFDAQKLLQHLMAQALWMGAVDIGRANRVRDNFNEHAFEADLTHGVDAGTIGRDSNAPYGQEGMSDHEDAIMGFKGDSEEAVPPSYDEIRDAVQDVNLWLGVLADTIGLLPLPYTSVEAGANARGRKLWREITDLSTAFEIQSERNLKALQKRNAVRAAESVLRNIARFDALVAQAA